MSDDEHYTAHPRLYGAPAYARPPLRTTPTTLPPDPDDLPIAAEQTPQERQFSEQLDALRFGIAEASVAGRPESGRRQGPLSLGAFAGRILRRAF